MKPILTFIALFIAANCFAQKEYTAINGVTYKIGDTVHLGRGSSPAGTFLYLQMGGWAAVMTYDASKGPNQLNIGRGYANTAVVIKKIKTERIKGIEKYYFVVGGGNITNYNLMIDDAIQACEVVPCQNPNAPVIVQQSDKFDQLKKLKDLLDSGALTQAEYDAQKKKLLDQ